MATKVNLSVNHPIAIGNVDVKFEIRTGDILLGTLTISKGSIDWRRANARKSARKNWHEFSELMS